MTAIDPIADMLTRIRNAQAVKKTEVVMPFSKIKVAIAEILQKEGYLGKVTVSEAPYREITLKLKYDANKKPVIRSLQRVSKLGRRIYASHEELPKVLNGLGIAIVTTSKGVMTNKEAKKAGIGGEVICEIC